MNQCDGSGQLLDTSVIDTLLGFFSDDTSSLCSGYSVESFAIRLGKDMIFGIDEEQALLVNAIASNFPASEHFLCTKHLKDGTRAYMQAKVGVPQKDRKIIRKKNLW